MVKSLKRFARDRKAISGLETAIVLIAFVIVASAFAYAILNLGFLAVQKSQQVVLGGLAAASSALVIDGPIYGYSQNPGSNATMDHIIFWLKTASGASSIDLNQGRTTVSFQNPRGVWPNIYVSNTTNFQIAGTTFIVTSSAMVFTWEAGTGFQLLPGEKVRVTIDLTQLTILGASAAQTQGLVWKNEPFMIIIKPPVGSVLEIDRVAPPAVSLVNDLG